MAINIHKINDELRNRGREQLNIFHDYITNPTEQEGKEPWFSYNSFEHVSREDDFIDFTFLSRKFRLSLKLYSEQRTGQLILQQRTYSRVDHENNPIWDFHNIEDMALSYSENQPVQFLKEESSPSIPVKTRPTSDMRKSYVVRLERLFT